jgi:hypothetical protein
MRRASPTEMTGGAPSKRRRVIDSDSGDDDHASFSDVVYGDDDEDEDDDRPLQANYTTTLATNNSGKQHEVIELDLSDSDDDVVAEPSGAGASAPGGGASQSGLGTKLLVTFPPRSQQAAAAAPTLPRPRSQPAAAAAPPPPPPPLPPSPAVPSLSYAAAVEHLRAKFDSGGGIEVDSMETSLVDSYALMKINVPARGLRCTHLKCFDRATYMASLRQCHQKCPVCNMHVPPEDVYVDLVRHCPPTPAPHVSPVGLVRPTVHLRTLYTCATVYPPARVYMLKVDLSRQSLVSPARLPA